MSIITSRSRDETILAAVDIRIKPVRLTFFYQAGLFAAGMLMLLLPVIYVALIVLIGYGTWYWIEYGLIIFETRSAPSIIQFLGYVVPLVVGPTMVLFMVKPLFAPKQKTPSPHVVTRQEQPLLYQYAERLAYAVHAPPPSQIAIDMDVNASASFRRGVRNLFDNNLVLTVGLPLVGGLNLTQLTGVLAHEFGHFNQSFAMRFGYIISTLNAWFTRVVYERDTWDLQLEELYQRPGSLFVLLIVTVSRFMVWLSRRLLWVLMVLGQGMSSFLSRQMEYNADENQARLTGNEVYRTTHFKIQVLSMAMERALAGLKELWGERRLVDDLVPLVLVEADMLTSDPEITRQIEASLLEAKTGFFDTHPAPRERLTRVSKFNPTAQIEDSRPASDLFREFDVLSVSLTLDFYQQHVDEEVDEQNILPMAEVLAQRKEREAAVRALERFFLNVPLLEFGVFPDTRGLEATASPDDAISVLHHAREHMSTMMGQVMSDIERYLEADEIRKRVKIAHTLFSANVKFKAKQLGLSSGDWPRLQQQLVEVEQELADLRERLTPAMAVALSRLDACLTLLRCRERHPVLNNLNCDAERYRRLVTALVMLGGVWPKLRALHHSVEGLILLFQVADANRDNRAFQRMVSVLVEVAYNTTKEVLQPLAEAEYPFEHVDGSVSIAQYAEPKAPERTANAILEASIGVVERMGMLYGRIWGELASAAEQVEKALGLSPLPSVSAHK